MFERNAAASVGPGPRPVRPRGYPRGSGRNAALSCCLLRAQQSIELMAHFGQRALIAVASAQTPYPESCVQVPPGVEETGQKRRA